MMLTVACAPRRAFKSRSAPFSSLIVRRVNSTRKSFTALFNDETPSDKEDAAPSKVSDVWTKANNASGLEAARGGGMIVAGADAVIHDVCACGVDGALAAFSLRWSSFSDSDVGSVEE